MAGYRGLRVSSPMASRVDYKGGGDLKSCFSEFSLNLLVAPPSVGHSPILTEYHVSDLLLLSSLSRFSRTASPLTIYLCGPHWVEELGASDHVLPSVEELIARIEATPITDSLILVKGSNGIHLGRLLPSL